MDSLRNSICIKATLFVFIWCTVDTAFGQDSSVVFYRTLTIKNPGVAFALSAVIPGAGVMYNEQVKLGLGILAAEGALFYSGTRLMSYYNTKREFQLEVNRRIANGLLISTGALHLAQMVYAALYAERWNKQHGFGEKNVNRLRVGLNPSGIGLCLVIR